MSAYTPIATTLPTMRWEGWRPPFLDHEVDQRAGHLILVLEREGDTLLLPCAEVSYVFAYPTWEQWQEADALRLVWGDGADQQIVERALSQLEAEGWQVIGRLEIEFVGLYAEERFWQHVQAVLRQHQEAA